jgi:predicted ArsR family transcriptional regulator
MQTVSSLMAKESFMLVSLREDKAKKLAQVISNPTCTKILNYLAGKDATESQVAKDLGIPLSTVHYNLQQLVDAKLVIAEEFHYSEKGREVNHYKLANKYIIIAPQEDDSFLQHIRKYIPAAIIVAVTGMALKIMQLFSGTAESEIAPEATRKMAVDTAIAGEQDLQLFAATAPVPEPAWWQSQMIDYFIAGALFVVAVVLIIEFIRFLRKR